VTAKILFASTKEYIVGAGFNAKRADFYSARSAEIATVEVTSNQSFVKQDRMRNADAGWPHTGVMKVKKIIGLLQCVRAAWALPKRPARRRQDACTTELPGLIFHFHNSL
jgi:hypothetical protein